MREIAITLQALNLVPVHACAGVALRESLVVETGLEFDHAWRVVTADGVPLAPPAQTRLQQVTPTLRTHDLVLRAPGMLALHLALDTVEAACQVRLGEAPVAAYDMGDLAAQWFSDFLGRPVRLARFDPDRPRVAVLDDGTAVPCALNDRAGVRIASAALESAGVTPNLVLAGLPDGSSELRTIIIDADDGAIRLDVIPAPAASAPVWHAVVADGLDRMLRVGARGTAQIDD